VEELLRELREFAEGPLFRASFVILVAGLARRFVLLAWPAAEGLWRANDRTLPRRKLLREIFGWIVPVEHLGRSRPFFSAVSFVFHIGLILVPLFLGAHLALWKSGTGLGWIMHLALPGLLLEVLVPLTIIAGLVLLVLRAAHKPSRQFSRASDYALLVLLLVPFITGFVVAEAGLGGAAREAVMLAHVLSAEAVFVVIPFSRLAHCVLFPVSRGAREISAKLILPTPPPGYPVPSPKEPQP
jgi:nitrate reductase gamma subunit